MPQLHIQLLPGFSADHEQAVTDYLAGGRLSRKTWRKTFEAFDLLDEAVLLSDTGRRTFRELYEQVVESRFADAFLRELIALRDVRGQSLELWARYARRISEEFVQRGWKMPDVPETRLLLGYLLYWWRAFALGYAFEVEVFHDLQQSGVAFQAHNLLDHQQRRSRSDLIVSGMAGDIKTSAYFVQVAAAPIHDFYIVRLTAGGHEHVLVAMLQPLAWDRMDGDTVEADLSAVAGLLPGPVRIRERGHELIVIDYADWKRRMLHLQGGE